MAMTEPISSVMSYQAQTMQPVRVAQKTVAEDTTAQKTETTVTADPTVAKVVAVEQKDGQTGQNTGNGGQQPGNEQLKKAVEQMNKQMSNSEAVFGIHEGTNRVTIKIVDKDTKKVIKELPPEKTLDMIAKVWEMAGILVDEKR